MNRKHRSAGHSMRNSIDDVLHELDLLTPREESDADAGPETRPPQTASSASSLSSSVGGASNSGQSAAGGGGQPKQLHERSASVDDSDGEEPATLPQAAGALFGAGDDGGEPDADASAAGAGAAADGETASSARGRNESMDLDYELEALGLMSSGLNGTINLAESIDIDKAVHQLGFSLSPSSTANDFDEQLEQLEQGLRLCALYCLLCVHTTFV